MINDNQWRMEIGNLPDKGFKVIMGEMPTELRDRCVNTVRRTSAKTGEIRITELKT